MRILNFATASPEKPRWERTTEGWLRCRARILAERVMPYARAELQDMELPVAEDPIHMLVRREDLNDAASLKSLEGIPVVAGDHKWMTAGNVKQFAIGSVAGSPRLDGDYLECGLLITDPDTVRRIESGELPEISAGYTAEVLFGPGEHNGTPFSARQTALTFNHIAIIPAGHGRAGEDVRILNKIIGEKTMSHFEKGRASAFEAIQKRLHKIEESQEKKVAGAKLFATNTMTPHERLGFERVDRAEMATRRAIRNGKPRSFFIPTPDEVRTMMANSKADRAAYHRAVKAERAEVLRRLGFVE